MPRDQVLMSDYSNRLSGALSLRDPSLKYNLLENFYICISLILSTLLALYDALYIKTCFLYLIYIQAILIKVFIQYSLVRIHDILR